MEPLPITATDTQTNPSSSSLSQSPGKTIQKLVLLNFLTLGLYPFYWFFQNWRDFRGKIWDKDISPFWRSVGIFVPILGLILIYRQFKKILDYVRVNVTTVPDFSPGLMAFLWYLQYPLNRMSSKYLDGLEPFPTIFIILVSTFVLSRFQMVLNVYWQETYPDLALQKKLTTGEKVFATLGGIFWCLFLLSIFLPE